MLRWPPELLEKRRARPSGNAGGRPLISYKEDFTDVPWPVYLFSKMSSHGLRTQSSRTIYEDVLPFYYRRELPQVQASGWIRTNIFLCADRRTRTSYVRRRLIYSQVGSQLPNVGKLWWKHGCIYLAPCKRCMGITPLLQRSNIIY